MPRDPRPRPRPRQDSTGRRRATSAPSAPRGPRLRHAVVVGGSIGGLAAAAALAPHADRVTIVERDDLPTGPERRAGVPQGRHVHGLQPGGAAALERLIPGFQAELRAAGAHGLRVGGEILWLGSAGWLAPTDTGEVLLAASRELIEWTIRRLVAAEPGVEVRPGLDVVGLAVFEPAGAGAARTVGVDVRRRRDGTGGAVERIDADLVVDASGRRSAAPDWLAAAGFPRPDETVVDARLSYATRAFRRRAGDTTGWKAGLLQGQVPRHNRSGFAFPIEGDRWLITLSGLGGEAPPTDEAGYLAFARSLRAPHIADLIERAEPLGPITGYSATENRRRAYDRLDRRPEGFVVLGDAAVAFDPVFGQGMSTAALGGEALGRAVADHRRARSAADRSAAGPLDVTGLARVAQKAIVATAEGAWAIATGVDARHPASGVRRSVADRVMGRYFDRVGAAMATDPVVVTAFFRVLGLLDPPEALMRPAVVRRVLLRRLPAAPTEAPWPSTAAPAPAP